MAVGIGLPAWMVYSPQTLTRPTYDVVARNYQHYRIPRPPVAEAGGSPPGQICWGTVGQMPSAEPAPTVGFTVKSEEWTETSRKSQIVRVENPDDPSQYVMEDRPTQVKFSTTSLNPRSGPNTSTRPAPGMSDYTVEEQEGFVEQGPNTIGGTAVMQFMEPGTGHGPGG
jgi:hypothetical protein